ncbi:prepilin peptidase [Atopobacter sp. AH10]|uniref:prepilin peptidase n=1 Tax=Atopobacter sp. AH10 TaxID=2315861 RepID=UPI000EF1C209|nr:prepilin peptidase [Atopobacter sp. AH10]
MEKNYFAPAFSCVLLFFYGSSFFSFLTAQCTRWIYQVPRRSRSYCFHCQTSLRCFDLIPVFSYIILRGRCRYCHYPIPSYHLFGEICAGIWTTGLFYGTSPSLSNCLAFLIGILLLSSSVVDCMILSIPDRFWILMFFLIQLSPSPHHYFALLLVYFSLWCMSLSLKGGLGGADIKALSLLACYLPFSPFILLNLLASGLALVWQAYYFFRHRKTKKELPFLPFIALSFILVYLFSSHLSFPILPLLKFDSSINFCPS